MPFDDRMLNGLGILAAVVKSGTFAVAGRSLTMSYSGASRAIAHLETRLGVRLLERTTRTVTLREEGAGSMNRSFLWLRDWKKQRLRWRLLRLAGQSMPCSN